MVIPIHKVIFTILTDQTCSMNDDLPYVPGHLLLVVFIGAWNKMRNWFFWSHSAISSCSCWIKYDENVLTNGILAVEGKSQLDYRHEVDIVLFPMYNVQANEWRSGNSDVERTFSAN